MDRTPDVTVESLLRLLAEQSRELAVIVLDREGRVAWWGRGAGEIFGYTEDAILGRPAEVLFTPEDRTAGVPQWEREVALQDDGAEDDRWQLRADGSRFWAMGILTAVRGPGREVLGFVKVLRNRTDLREQTETLRNVARGLEESGQRKDVFLSTLSHELRNPLAPIANALQIVRMSNPRPGPETAYALKVIERQAHLLERLVDDLLDLSRVGAGKIRLDLAPLALQELVPAAVDGVGDLVRKRGHRLDVVMPAGPILVRGDRDRLHQVAVNLLRNAAKYTPPGGRITVKASTEGDEALLRVADDGVGIPTEMQPRIFDLFTQVETARRSSEGGLGIGLALVKDLVTLHGGSVQVRSDGEGKGAEFTVRLPLLSA